VRIVRAADRSFVPAGHEDPVSPGAWKKVLFAKDDLQPGRVQMVNWARMPAGKTFAPHYHEDMQEMFIILGGEGEIAIGGERADLNAGDSVLIDAREVHEMRNRGQEDLEYLAIGIAGGVGGKTVVVAQPAADQPEAGTPREH
jgi:mannose-6-phosphate isomerase-like protein (cupin superfamily)